MSVRRISAIAALLFVIAGVCAKDDPKQEPAANAEDALPKGAIARFATRLQRRAVGPVLTEIRDIAFSSDGKEILTLGGFGDLHRWKSATYDMEERLQYQGALRPLLISPSKAQLIGMQRRRESIGAMNLTDGELVHSFETNDTCRPHAVSPNGEIVLTTNSNFILHAWLMKDGTQLATIANVHSLYRPVFAADNQSFFVEVWSANGTTRPLLQQICLKSGKCVKEFRSGDRLLSTQALMVSPDNRRLISIAQLSSIQVREVSTTEVNFASKDLGENQDGRSAAIAISPDGNFLAIATYGGVKYVNLHVWDARRMKSLVEWQIYREPHYTLVMFSPDSSKLFTATDEVLVWNVSQLLKGTANPETPVDGEQLWKDLGVDASIAFKMVAKALDAPKSSVECLKSNLRPILKADADKITPLEAIRQDRALEILEAIGSSEAKKLMEELAAGEPTAKLTQDAKAGLERLKRREAAKAPPE